jgi:hypothetical protein
VPRIRELYWDDNNRDHLWQSHQVTPEEVGETLFSEDGEEAVYLPFRDGDYLEIYGETSSGRLLKMVGEFMKDGRFRIFAARDMDDREKRAFRKR